jgi:hypothetical protein
MLEPSKFAVPEAQIEKEITKEITKIMKNLE